MDSFGIFLIQAFLSLVLYGLIATWYVAPRLGVLPLHAALPPLLFVHAFRHLGLVFLVPAVVAPTLPSAFAVPAAWGDLLAALLAMAALIALRGRAALGVPLAWVANVVGLLDLAYAISQGIANDVGPHLGSAWYVPTFLVPALIVTHLLIFARLLRRAD